MLKVSFDSYYNKLVVVIELDKSVPDVRADDYLSDLESDISDLVEDYRSIIRDSENKVK